MAEIVEHITDAKDHGTINLYAVRYYHRGKSENTAVALPGNFNQVLQDDFCESISEYKTAREAAFNPTSDGLEDHTYEFVPLSNVLKKWGEIKALLDTPLDYSGSGNRRKVPGSNLYICVLDYNERRYYLCAKQGSSTDRLFRGKRVLMSSQDNIREAEPGEVFLMSSCVDFIVDTVEEKILIFDKRAFQDVFKYDDYQKEEVQKNISIVEKWSFLESSAIIEERCNQKNVYRNLAKIFADPVYLAQIQNISPIQLKMNLLRNSPANFTENDFEGNYLMITDQNLDTVMKMLAKGFKFNFFTNNAEQQ